MSSGLEEIPIDGQTRKSSKYRKEFFRYPRVIQSYGAEPMKPGQILIEVNTFANPYPFEIKSISSFIYDFLLRQNAEDVIEEYELQPFLLPGLAYTQIPSPDTIKQSLNKILTRINLH